VVAAGAPVSFIGVRMAVNAISPFAGGAIDGAGAGSCGAPVTVAFKALGVEDDCVAAGAVDIAGIGTGATRAVKFAMSTTLRNCFFASVATGRAAVGAAEALGVVRLLKIDAIAESSTRGVATGVADAAGALEEAVEPATCDDVAGIVTGVGKEYVE